MKTLKKLSIVVVLFTLIFYSIAGEYFYRATQGIKTRSPEANLAYQINNNSIDTAWFNKSNHENIQIQSEFNYTLDGILFKKNDSIKNTIIVCHGVAAHKYAMFRFAKMYCELGFNVFVFDSRGHGESGGAKYSFGYFEKFDIETVVLKIKELYPNGIIGVHGESMGAAGSLMHSYINKETQNVSFYIEDCGYSSLKEQIKHRLKVEYNLPNFGIIEAASFATKLHDGFFFKDVTPINTLSKIKTPILFIHGMDDKYVPAYMGEHMYNIKPSPKELYLAPNAKHAGAYQANPEKYKQKIQEFLVTNGFTQL